MAFDDSETVGSEEAFWSNAIFKKQKQYTQEMRSSMLSCMESDSFSVKNTMSKILALRVYHQIARIIRYTEEMDKIEQKLYQVVDLTLDKMDPMFIDENTQACLSTLMHLQQKLQQSMIDSQKLLDPYLTMDSLWYVEVPSEDVAMEGSEDVKLLSQDSRQKIRKGAQEALAALNSSYSDE